MATNRRTNNPIAKVYGDETRTLMTEAQPADRGDATRLDPDVIERAAKGGGDPAQGGSGE